MEKLVKILRISERAKEERKSESDAKKNKGENIEFKDIKLVN